MPIKDMQAALAHIESNDYPLGVKVLAKAIRLTIDNPNKQLHIQIVNYLQQFLATKNIHVKQCIHLVDAMIDSQLFDKNELKHIVDLKNNVHKNALALAIQTNNIWSLRKLLSLDADFELRVGIYNYKPLALAVTQNQVSAARCLLDKGATVTDEIYRHVVEKDYICRPELAIMLRQRFKQAFHSRLSSLQRGGEDNQQIQALLTMLHNKRLMFECKLDVPLLEAIRWGYSHAALSLIKAIQGNVEEIFDATDSQGNTALHLAAANGCNNVLQSLTHAGAMLFIKNNAGQIPLDAAIARGQTSAVSLLLGSMQSLVATSGSPQVYAEQLLQRLRCCEYADIQMLLCKAIGVAKRGLSTSQAITISMFYLAIEKNVMVSIGDIILDLTVAGTSLHVKNSEGETALHIAARCQHMSMVRLLAEKILLQQRMTVRQMISNRPMSDETRSHLLAQERKKYTLLLQAVIKAYPTPEIHDCLSSHIAKAAEVFAQLSPVQAAIGLATTTLSPIPGSAEPTISLPSGPIASSGFGALSSSLFSAGSLPSDSMPDLLSSHANVADSSYS